MNNTLHDEGYAKGHYFKAEYNNTINQYVFTTEADGGQELTFDSVHKLDAFLDRLHSHWGVI